MARRFSTSFPGAKIYCFEPVADTYRQLRAATADTPHAVGMLRTGVRFVLSEVGMTPSDTRHSYFHGINDFLSDFSFRLTGFYDTIYRSDGTVEYANALFVRSTL